MKVINIANENASACTPCGGQCCKGMPGIYHPDDLFSNMSDVEIKNKMITMLESGTIVFTDNEISDSRGKYSIRVESLVPRAGNRTKNWYQPFNYGQCINLGDTGCTLSSDERPRECRALVPSPEGASKCKPEAGFDREDLLNEWTIYEEIVQEVHSHFHSH
jgi:Fe-S-cluster containining protein